MDIKRSTVRKIMKKKVNCPISVKAIIQMTRNIQNLVESKTLVAERILVEENKLREVQGLRKKVRLSDEEIKEAFTNEKTFNL